VGGVMEYLSTYIMGTFPLTPRGNSFVLVVTDHFSKWVEIFAVSHQTAKTSANVILNEVISRYWSPSSLHSDLEVNLRVNFLLNFVF
jgi:hypothetical protein